MYKLLGFSDVLGLLNKKMEGFVFQPEFRTSKRGQNLVFLFTVLAVVGIISSASYFISSSSPLISEFLLEQQEFSNFVMFHNKQYASDTEYQYRFQVYRENSALIRAHNSLDSGVILAANKFADLTQAEFKARYTQEITIRDREPEEIISVESPPSSWDWRDLGAVTDVGDQNYPNSCSSSWAFASVGAIEGIWKISGHELQDLSVQEILDCQTSTGDHGCKGGNDDDAFAYVMKHNITTDVIYPYIAANGTCNQQAVSQYVASISNYTDVKPRDSASLFTAIYGQPVVSAVQADQYVWQFYQQGVISQFCGIDLDHYILIVGYDFNAGYYICKNSWGENWGESGYVRIASGSGYGVCGIQTLISFPNITST